MKTCSINDFEPLLEKKIIEWYKHFFITLKYFCLQYFCLHLFVISSGCGKSGVYGSNCNIPCPTNCKDNMCHIQNGTCFSCQPGWMGTTCSTSKTVLSLNIYICLILFSPTFLIKLTL